MAMGQDLRSNRLSAIIYDVEIFVCKGDDEGWTIGTVITKMNIRE